MQVFSLFRDENLIASFPTRQDAVNYGKSLGGDSWEYDIVKQNLTAIPTTYGVAAIGNTPLTTVPAVWTTTTASNNVIASSGGGGVTGQVGTAG